MRGIDAYFEAFYPKNHWLESTNEWQGDYWRNVYNATAPIGRQEKIFSKGFIQLNF
jgi:hypothetical protein